MIQLKEDLVVHCRVRMIQLKEDLVVHCLHIYRGNALLVKLVVKF